MLTIFPPILKQVFKKNILYSVAVDKFFEIKLKKYSQKVKMDYRMKRND